MKHGNRSRIVGRTTGGIGHIILLFAGAGFADESEPIAPRDAIDLFQVEPGCRVELVAAEPTVVDPVAMAFDETGKLYVVENRGYPEVSGTVSGTVYQTP